MQIQFTSRTFLFMLFIMFSACGLGVVATCDDIYNFKVGFEVNPNLESYNVGDTIEISMISDNANLYDRAAFRTVEVPNFNPLPYLYLPKLDSFPIKNDGLKMNELIVPDGYVSELVDFELESMSKYSVLVIGTIESRPDSSFMQVKVVLKEPGTYALISSLALHVYHLRDETTEVSDRCSDRIELSATPFFYDERWYNRHILTESQNTVVDSIYWDSTGTSYTSYYFFNVLE